MDRRDLANQRREQSIRRAAEYLVARAPIGDRSDRRDHDDYERCEMCGARMTWTSATPVCIEDGDVGLACDECLRKGLPIAV